MRQVIDPWEQQQPGGEWEDSQETFQDNGKCQADKRARGNIWPEAAMRERPEVNNAAKRKADELTGMGGDKSVSGAAFCGDIVALSQLAVRAQFGEVAQWMTGFVVRAEHAFVIAQPEFRTEMAAT